MPASARGWPRNPEPFRRAPDRTSLPARRGQGRTRFRRPVPAEYWADQFTAANPALTASLLGTVVRLSYPWRGIIEAGVRPGRIAYRAAAIERKDHPLLDELRAQGVEIVMLPSALSGLG